METLEQIQQEFKELLEKEKELRSEFRNKRDELESMVQPIINHVNDCNNFWYRHFDKEVAEFIVVMSDKTAFKITRPDESKCYVESYLPFGIKAEEVKVIN